MSYGILIREDGFHPACGDVAMHYVMEDYGTGARAWCSRCRQPVHESALEFPDFYTNVPMRTDYFTGKEFKCLTRLSVL